MRFVARAFGAALLAACLSSCTRPPADEQNALAGLSFSLPFIMRVSLSQPIDNDGNLTNASDADLIAFFMKAGLVTTTPNTAGTPWWQFRALAPYYASGSLVVPVASRVITGRSEERFWTEGSVEYFAETITYQLRLMPALGRAYTGPNIASTLRLVMRKDPAVGHWEVDNDPARGTTWSQNDADALNAAVSDSGASDLDVLRDSIQTARTHSFDQIEQTLKAQGVMEKDASNARVRFSRSREFHYLPLGWYRLNGLTIGSLRTICANQKIGNLSWHFAHYNELAALFGQSNFFNQADVTDTPDHRIWPEFASIPQPGLLLVSDTHDANQPRAALAYKVEALGAQFKRQFQLTALWVGDNFDTAPLTDGEGGGFMTLPMCVSSGVAEGAPQGSPVGAVAPTRAMPASDVGPPLRLPPRPADMNAALQLREAQSAVARGDVQAAVMPLRLAVQYGGMDATGGAARALATSLASQLSPRAGVDDGCAIPVPPPDIDGTGASAADIAFARQRLAAYERATQMFAGCVEGVLSNLSMQATANGGALGPALANKLRWPVGQNEDAWRRTKTAYLAAFRAYKAAHH